MFPMRISDDGNIWRITEEEVLQLRSQTMLDLQSRRTNDETHLDPSSPSSVCSSNASLDLTMIPSPETFFADDSDSDKAAPVSEGHGIQQNAARPLEIFDPIGEAFRGLEIRHDEQAQTAVSSETLNPSMEFQQQHFNQPVTQTTGINYPPGFPRNYSVMTLVGPEFNILAPRPSWRPSPWNYVAFPAHYCFFHFKTVEFHISGPTRNGVIFPGIEYFHITCIDPCGRLCFVTCNYSWPNASHYICKFFATVPGNYIAFIRYMNPVEMATPINIRGSPLILAVSRDYGNAILETFSTVSQVQPRHYGEFQCSCSLWGIDVHKYTKRVYVTDKSTNMLRIFSPEGYELTLLRRHTQGLFNYPAGIVVDHLNTRLIIADRSNHRIVFCDLDGVFMSSFGRKGIKCGQFQHPWGVAVSPNGQLIAVADSRNHRLQMFDQFGNYLRKYIVFGNNARAMFDYPRGICFDRDGKYVYCSDFYNHVIFRLSIDFKEKISFTLPGALLHPQGLAVDEVGNLLVCEKNHCIRVFTPKGQLMAVLTGNGDECIQLPQDLCILPNGQLLIVDGTHIRIY